MTRAHWLILASALLIGWALYADWREAADCERRGGRVVRWSGVPMRCVVR